MAFLEDPRLRQRWNQISHNAEAVTENAAAGIWTFQHRYINPCLGSLAASFDSCTSLCLGDREERARRQRERERGARGSRAEYSFDFYDDWDDEDDALADSFGSGGRGLLGGWAGGRAEDWDRLVAGTGSSRSRTQPEVVDQPRRKRGMSYGTRGGGRRKQDEQDDPTIIPSTAPLGFLGRLPFKIGGTLRYKPSAANLRDHPGSGGAHPGEHDEHEPLLGAGSEEEGGPYGRWNEAAASTTRKRSGTAGSGDTSDSFRSRGDLFPSDEEGDEDAVPLDDEFAVALDRVDDRSSGKTRSSKGKRRADSKPISRSVSRTTLASSQHSADPPLRLKRSTSSLPLAAAAETPGDTAEPPSLEHLHREEELARREQDEEVERKRRAAAQLALQRGLTREDEGDDGDDDSIATEPVHEVKADILQDVPDVGEIQDPSVPELGDVEDEGESAGSPPPALPAHAPAPVDNSPAHNSTAAALQRDEAAEEEGFVPARLPHFK